MDFSEKGRDYLFFSLLAITGLAAFLAMLYATVPGLGVSPDSVVYFAGAQSLRAGDGYSFPDGIGEPDPITHFPPFYSALLAGLSFTGLAVMEAARLLHAALYAGSGILLGLLIYQGTRKDLLLALGGVLLFWVVEDLVLIHTFLWTEPLYYFLTLLGFLLLLRTLRTGKWNLLFLSALAAGLAFLTRYAGLANAAAGAALFFLFSGRWADRIRRAAVYIAVSIGVPGLILAWSAGRPGAESGRGWFYHPLDTGSLQRTLNEISRWVVPGRFLGSRIQWVILAAVSSVILFLVIRAAARWVRGKVSVHDLEWVMSIFHVICYTGMLLMTVLFVDAQATLRYRLLSPLIPALILFILASSKSITLHRRFSAAHLLLFALIPVIGFNLVHSWKFVQRSHAGSRKEFNGESWRQAEIIHWLDNLPDGTPVYSNGNDAVYFVSGKPSARLPYRSSPHTRQPNPDFELEMGEMEAALREGGVILYFPAIKWRYYLVSLDELQERYQFTVLFENESGVIVGLAE